MALVMHTYYKVHPRAYRVVNCFIQLRGMKTKFSFFLFHLVLLPFQPRIGSKPPTETQKHNPRKREA